MWKNGITKNVNIFINEGSSYKLLLYYVYHTYFK